MIKIYQFNLKKMWRAKIKIIDEIVDIEQIVSYPIWGIIRYLDLLEKLHTFYPIEKYNNFVLKFSFYFSGNKIPVDDLTNYILNNECIEIKISSSPPLYYLEISSEKIKSSYDIKELYKYYFENLKDCEVFLFEENKGKYKLLDVLISEDLFYNHCIDRLISRYYY